jgi:N-acetylglutamate synthase-like GNAT family acetyltransferase
VKGQKLFVRPIEAADADAIRAFAVLVMDIEADAVRVVDLVVAEELRRKRIGRVMLNELAALAAKLERNSLIADVKHAEFLRRVGFIEDQGVMKRRVG